MPREGNPERRAAKREIPSDRAALTAVPGGATRASPAFALNILICNDDGITAANVRVLKQQLVAAGHQAIITAPIDTQSGTGGFVRFLQPTPVLLGTGRGARALSLPAGTPGVGANPTQSGVYEVNGTPVMACLYGIVRRRRASSGGLRTG